MLLRLVAFGVIGYAGMRYLSNRDRTSHAAYGDGQVGEGHTDIRDAGPGAMRDPARRKWTDLDQALDESFPASDPPANY